MRHAVKNRKMAVGRVGGRERAVKTSNTKQSIDVDNTPPLPLTSSSSNSGRTRRTGGTSNLIRCIIRGGGCGGPTTSAFLFQSGKEGRSEIALLSPSLSVSAAKKQNVKRAAWIKRRGRGREGGVERDDGTKEHRGFCHSAATDGHSGGLGSRQAGRQHKRSQISFSLTRHDSIITGGSAQLRRRRR